MGFNEELKTFSQRANQLAEGIQTEEATKMSMIVPFFQILGYDVFNPAEFCPEYTADVGIKKGEKVDYAILLDGIPQILIECKWCGQQLGKHDSQLFRYFGTSSAKFAILTNGLEYRFYTDLDEANKMDLTPFLTIDIQSLKEPVIAELRKFCKDSFDKDNIFSTASELKYSNLIHMWLTEQAENVSDEFARVILGDIYDGLKTQKIIDKFKPIIKKSFNNYINDLVNKKISSALAPDESEQTEKEPEPTPSKSKIVTTEEELQAFNIIRAILAEEVELSKVTYRDTESYFGILYDNNNRKPICRLNLDSRKKHIMIPDEKKNFTRYDIENIVSLYEYKAQIIAAAKIYDVK